MPLLALHLPKSCTEDLYKTFNANHHLCGSGERNGEQRWALVKSCVSVGAAAVDEKAHLGTKWLRKVQKSSP